MSSECPPMVRLFFGLSLSSQLDQSSSSSYVGALAFSPSPDFVHSTLLFNLLPSPLKPAPHITFITINTIRSISTRTSILRRARRTVWQHTITTFRPCPRSIRSRRGRSAKTRRSSRRSRYWRIFFCISTTTALSGSGIRMRKVMRDG